ncbi:MAG TPA: redoxin domain-containing protein [Anaerolineae bacterium]|nr:redoxin domain-containing protein [Anaerolineae bacterium]
MLAGRRESSGHGAPGIVWGDMWRWLRCGRLRPRRFLKPPRSGKGKNDLPFVLLSDPDHEVAETYGVWGEKKMYGKTFMGIVRSHFVMDEEGQVRDVQIKVSPKKSVELAVAAL